MHFYEKNTISHRVFALQRNGEWLFTIDLHTMCDYDGKIENFDTLDFCRIVNITPGIFRKRM
jgi:hypothetical protein